MTQIRRRRLVHRDGQDGMVTAELAVALPVLAVVLAGCLAVLGAVSLQGRCADAAGFAARSAARGDATASVAAVVDSVVPGAAVDVDRRGDLVTATVSAVVRPLGTDGPAVTVSAVATALAGVDGVGAAP